MARMRSPKRQCLLAGVQDKADEKVVFEAFGKVLQPAEVLSPDGGTGLDVNRDNFPAPVLENDVDLDLVPGAVVVHLGPMPGPGELAGYLGAVFALI
jgi:hypothetical protein